MDKLFEKGISFGLGLFTMTREKGEQIVEQLIEKGEISRKEASGVLDDLLNRAEKEKKELEKRINSSLEKTLENFNLPTKDEVEELNKKLDEISQKLDAMESNKES